MESKSQEAPVSAQALRLLIVEDQPPAAELMVATLERAGYTLQYDLTDNRKEYAQLLEGGGYDLVLSDHNLRTWFGTEALEMARRADTQLPFIVVASTLGEEAAVEYVKQGATDYVLKSRLERLPVAVARALQERTHLEEQARLQATIQRASREWQVTFDSVPDVVLLLDEQLRIQRTNRAATRLLGLGFPQIIGRKCCEVFHCTSEPPEDCPGLRTLETGEDARADIENRRLGKIFDVTSAPQRDASGVLRGCVEVLHDITERKQAEILLKNTEERLTLAASAGDVGVWDLDLLTDEAWRSPQHDRIFGYDSLQPHWGQQIFLRHVLEQDREFVRQRFQQAIESGQLSLECRILRADQELRWIAVRGEVSYGDGGKPVRIMGVIADITERERAAEALRRSEERYRGLFENATFGILHSSRDGSILDANPALVSMFGYDSLADLQQANLERDIYLNPDVRAQLLREFDARGRAGPCDIQIRRKDGKHILVRSSGRALRFESGQATEFEVILDDITEQRALEIQLRDAQKFEAIGQLAGGIAHDFNNVLGAMLGRAELGLDAAPPDSPLRPHLEQIRMQAHLAANLTHQLLAFARRQAMDPRSVNLNRTVSDVVSLLRNVIGENIEVKTVLGADLRPAWADPSRVQQVLMNLCVNARDAMPAGGHLTIETRNAEFDEEFCRSHAFTRPGHYVEIIVTDTGVGMDPATLEHIFEPFFTTKGPGKGTGMGLATVYGIVKQSDGVIRVYSEPGHGTTFYVALPAGPAAGAVAVEDVESSEPARGGTETIMLAEDSEPIRNTLVEGLEKLGYHVLVACDGEEAISLFSQHGTSIALLILDVVMPRAGGPEVCARIRASGSQVPVFFVTGYSQESRQLEELVRDGAHLVSKPVSLRKLDRQMREVLDRASISAQCSSG